MLFFPKFQKFSLHKLQKIAMWADDDERMINYEWPNI